MTRVLVTAAAQPTGRNSIRALCQHEDIEIVAADSREEGLAKLPFDVAKKVTLPPPEHPAFVDMLMRVCHADRIEVVLPCLETIVAALSKHKAAFADLGVSVPVPDYDVLLRGMDKWNLMEAANAAGVPHPKSIHLRSGADIDKISSLSYPIIAKPTIGRGARGVLIYERPPTSWKDLKKAIRKNEMIVQEYIPGETGSIYVCGLVFDQNHEIKLCFQSKSTKTEFDFGGPALAGISVHEPELRSCAERLVRAVGPWVGIALLEFKRHSKTHEFCILDFNPRIWGYSSLAEDAGLSFPFASVLVAQNKDFLTHDDFLVGVQMERNGLIDESTYTFSCGKHVNISRHNASGTNRRRVVAVFRDTGEPRMISSAITDDDVDAILVVGNDRAVLAGLGAQQKIHFWTPPGHLRNWDLPYWAGHLLQATEVRLMDGQTCQRHSWPELRHGRWWGVS